MPKAIKKKVSRKEQDTEAEVKDKLQDIRKVLEKRQKTLVSYGLVVLSAVIVLGGIALYRYNSNEKAQQLEYDGYKTLYGPGQTSRAGQDKLQKALELFEQAYAKRKSPRLLLSIADVYAELGRSDDALKTLDDFTRRYARQEGLLPLVYQKMAAIQLSKGNSEEALKSLDKISAVPGDLLRDAALLQKARIFESQGKKDEAMALYKELIEKYPRSPYVEDAKAKIGEKKEG